MCVYNVCVNVCDVATHLYLLEFPHVGVQLSLECLHLMLMFLTH